MKDGYYLSTYMEIDKLANLYRFAHRHDQNVSLWYVKNNKVSLIHYWELERLTGIKHHRQACFDLKQAKEILNTLLKSYNLSLKDMTGIWGTPELATSNDYHSLSDFPQLTYHSISHLFSAIMSDSELFYNEIIIGFALDMGSDCIIDNQVQDKPQFAGCVSFKGEIEMFPVYSPGIIWGVAAEKFKLEEGTLMALSSASTSVAYFEHIDLKNFIDKSRIELEDYICSLYDWVSRLRNEDAGTLFNGFDTRFTIEENRISMIMKKIHEISNAIIDFNITEIVDHYKVDPRKAYVAMSGGFALNCPTNNHVMGKFKFKGFLAPPCVNDSGQSLGIALYSFYKKMGRFDFKLNHAFYGDQDNRLNQCLNDSEFTTYIKSINDLNIDQVIMDLEKYPIIWFDGHAEIGPRALGNRSILCDPRSQDAKNILNSIKGRQWWRPVAPIVLEEDMETWFENSYSSPFMLHTFKIKDKKISLIPAVAHLDGSARVQTINGNSCHLVLYTILKKFREKTGIPLVGNTSLNDRGEPIINRIQEVFNFALRKGIKVVYINQKRIELFRHDSYSCNTPMSREICFDLVPIERDRWINKLNPLNIPLGEVLLYIRYSNLVSERKFDIGDSRDVRNAYIELQMYKQKRKISNFNI